MSNGLRDPEDKKMASVLEIVPCQQEVEESRAERGSRIWRHLGFRFLERRLLESWIPALCREFNSPCDRSSMVRLCGL